MALHYLFLMLFLAAEAAQPSKNVAERSGIAQTAEGMPSFARLERRLQEVLDSIAPPRNAAVASTLILPAGQTNLIRPIPVKVEAVAQKKETKTPDKKSPPGTASGDQSLVKVNSGELSALIGGVNLNLRALETELDEQKDWNADRLGVQVAKLKSLAQQRRDLISVRDLLSDEERKFVPRPKSIRPLVAEIGQHIAALRAKTAEGPNPADLEKLNQLSKDLAALTAE
jgi:hypothetical protein